ncbi:MAG: CHASE domain-containing protein [Gemmatimonadaceae bacterium]
MGNPYEEIAPARAAPAPRGTDGAAFLPQNVARLLGIILGYVALGKLGLLLAEAPYYASPIFPAAGLGLVVVLLWGAPMAAAVAVGSFVLNLWVALESSTGLTHVGIAVAAGVAVGAALQALIASVLIRRWVGFPTSLESVRHAALLLTFGGPVGALIGATVGTGLLLAAGLVTRAALLFTWSSWWMGDMLGVLTVVPLVLSFTTGRSNRDRGRRGLVALPLLLAFVFEILLFIYVSRREERIAHAEFTSAGVELTKALDEATKDATEGGAALHDLIAASGTPDAANFSHLARGYLERHRPLRALAWAPRITHAQRDSFELEMRQSGRAEFEINQPARDSGFVRADDRPAYYPVQLAEQSDGSTRMVGFDLASERTRHEALQHASAARSTAVSGRVRFYRRTSGQYGILVAVPVYGVSQPSLRGFVVTMIDLDDLAEHALSQVRARGLRIRLQDLAEAPGERMLFQTDPGTLEQTPGGSAAIPGTRVPLAYSSVLAIGGRHWTLSVEATPEYIATHRTVQAWAALGIALILTSGLGTILLVVIGHASRVGRLVNIRTRELSDSNTRLRREIEDRERIERDLRLARDEAHAANRAKSGFLANMSHEIRTPMNGIIGMIGLLRQSALDERQRECADTVHRSADALLHIINDILDFSKIESGHVELESVELDVERLVDDACDSVALLADQKGLHLSGHVESSVPRLLCGDPARVGQVLMNLLSNAIKFTATGSIGVRVSIDREEGDTTILRFSVSDTGIGIPSTKVTSIFAPFIQEDVSTTRRFGGTGLGLSISRQLAYLMGGDIGVLSKERRGSTFWFTARFRRPNVARLAPDDDINLDGMDAEVICASDATREHLATLLRRWGARVQEFGSWPVGPRNFAGDPPLVVAEAALTPDSPEVQWLDGHRRLLRTVPVSARLLAHGGGDGMAAVLAEPVRRDRLAHMLRNLLGAPAGTPVTLPAVRPPLRTHILLVEDNEVNQLVARRMLEHLGHEVMIAANGNEALRLIQKTEFDLILMDCQMPELDGFGATQAIRSDTSGTSFAVPIVAMTANATGEDRRRCFDAGMNDFLSKPVTLEGLRETLGRWLPQDVAAAASGSVS